MNKDFIFNSELMATSKDLGFIYIFSSEAHPDLVKIGKTKRQPATRAEELSNSTSAPAPFDIEWSRFVEDDLNDLEKLIHDQLDEFRVNEKREFFKLPVPEAIEKVGGIIDEFLSFTWGKIKYRKKQDAMWGYFFQTLQIPFQYIPEPIKVIDRDVFQPDFWLPNQDCYVVISMDFMQHNSGRWVAYCYAKKTGKVLFQFWDCQPGFEDDQDGDLNIHTGSYMTPEGEYDTCMAFGFCWKCGSKHVGHLGFPDLGDETYRRTSSNNCGCYMGDSSEKLQEAYDRVRRIFGPHDRDSWKEWL